MNFTKIARVLSLFLWVFLGAAVLSGCGKEGAGGNTSTPGDSGNAVKSDPQDIIRKKYAGVYQTTSGPRTFAGGLGLFESGDYSLMFDEDGTKRSGTWIVEGSTIRLKAEDSVDTVLKILDSERLAYEQNGVEVVYTKKERE